MPRRVAHVLRRVLEHLTKSYIRLLHLGDSRRTLCTPRTSPARDLPRSKKGSHTLTAHPRTVLIVDDDHHLRRSLRLLLEEEGFAVLEAANGAAGLDILRKSAERMVVLLDLMMPEMSGDEVLNIALADRRLAHWHTYILMTAHLGVLCRCDLRAAQGVPVMSKLENFDTLLEVVAEAAGKLVPRLAPRSRPAILAR